MISGVAFTFVLLPCIVATAIAAVVRDSRVAIVCWIGAMALFALVTSTPGPVRLFGLPVVTGLALGLFFVHARLRLGLTELANTPDVWSRMLWALIPTFVVTFLFLLYVMNGA